MHIDDVVAEAILEEDGLEVDRLLVSDAIVSREGNHYRIESGGESWQELEQIAVRHGADGVGLCDCGARLSRTERSCFCRSCGRNYRS